MSAHVSLNLLTDLGKSDKMRGLPRLATSKINSITQERECKILYIIHMTLKLICKHVWM